MTEQTAEQTPEQTPEQIVAEAMVNAGAPLMHSRVEDAVGLFTTCSPEIAAALAAPPVINETKLAEVLDQKYPWEIRYGGDMVPNPEAAALRIGFKAGIEWLRGEQA